MDSKLPSAAIAKYCLCASSNDATGFDIKTSNSPSVISTTFSLSPHSYTELCCINTICGYTQSVYDIRYRYFMHPALLFARYLLLRGDIHDIYALATVMPMMSSTAGVLDTIPLSDATVNLIAANTPTQTMPGCVDRLLHRLRALVGNVGTSAWPFTNQHQVPIVPRPDVKIAWLPCPFDMVQSLSPDDDDVLAERFSYLSCEWAACEAVDPYVMPVEYLDRATFTAFSKVLVKDPKERRSLADLAERFLSDVTAAILTNMFGPAPFDDALVANFYRYVGVRKANCLEDGDSDGVPVPANDEFSLRGRKLNERDMFFTRHLGVVKTPSPPSYSIIPNSCLAYTYISATHNIIYTYTERSRFLIHFLRSLHATPHRQSMIVQLAR
jgi:hypothetical protein